MRARERQRTRARLVQSRPAPQPDGATSRSERVVQSARRETDGAHVRKAAGRNRHRSVRDRLPRAVGVLKLERRARWKGCVRREIRAAGPVGRRVIPRSVHCASPYADDVSHIAHLDRVDLSTGTDQSGGRRQSKGLRSRVRHKRPHHILAHTATKVGDIILNPDRVIADHVFRTVRRARKIVAALVRPHLHNIRLSDREAVHGDRDRPSPVRVDASVKQVLIARRQQVNRPRLVVIVKVNWCGSPRNGQVTSPRWGRNRGERHSVHDVGTASPEVVSEVRRPESQNFSITDSRTAGTRDIHRSRRERDRSGRK